MRGIQSRSSAAAAVTAAALVATGLITVVGAGRHESVVDVQFSVHPAP